MMKTGYSKVVINPETKLKLAGYDKHRPAEGVMDNLYVKAIILDNSENKICLISYDLIGIDYLLMEKVKSRCKLIDRDNIIFSVTHTHSGPMGTLDTINKEAILYNKDNIFGKTDNGYLDFLSDKTIEAINIAYNNIEKMQLSTLEYEINNIGSNRNNSALRGDPEVKAIIFENKNKKAVIFNYACHPTILNSENNRYSADLIGAISEAAAADFDFTIFFNGACGDISTRFNRKNSGSEELQRMGNIFYSSFLKNYSSRKATTNNNLSIEKSTISLKVKKPMALELAFRIYNDSLNKLNKAKESNIDNKKLRLIAAEYEGAKANLEYSQNYQGLKEYPIYYNLIEIAEMKFISYPGEIFSELTNPLKEKHHIGLIGYCDGYSLYLCDETAYEKSYYEAMSSPFEKGEGEKFIDIINKKLNS